MTGRIAFIAAMLLTARASAASLRCDDLSDLAIDGMLDDWKSAQVLARTGTAPDGAIALRCAWDGTALALSLDIIDDRVVRVRGKGHEDHVEIAVSAGGKPATLTVFPGNAIAKPRYVAPRRVEVADSLQPKGFSVEARIPAAAIPGYSASMPAFELHVVFRDSDAAAGGDDSDVALDATIELSDRKDLLDDFLRTVRLRRTDLKLDVMADLDPERRGKERLVAGGAVIGVLTDQFAYVTVPGEVKRVELLPFGSHGEQVVSAVVRQTGNGGARELLMLWTVWSGQLQPLVQIEVRKELGKNVLECTWKVDRGQLVVTPRPAIGWTADTWNEQPADDADPILLPWDTARTGIAYTMRGKEIARRDLKKRG